jgi:hypothetical protein
VNETRRLTRYLDELLETGRFRDYCPNGLQVEGRREVQRLVAGVSATQALLDAAVERRADTLLVHHGWFWRGEDGRVTGIRKKRLQTAARSTRSTSLPTICRSMAIASSATTRSWAGASAGRPTAASASRISAGWATWTPPFRDGGCRPLAANCSDAAADR